MTSPTCSPAAAAPPPAVIALIVAPVVTRELPVSVASPTDAPSTACVALPVAMISSAIRLA